MGNILFHLQFPAPAVQNVASWTTLFESWDQWTLVLQGTGANTKGVGNMLMTTGGTAGGIARVSKVPTNSPLFPSWTKNRTIQFEAATWCDVDNASENYICTGSGLPAADGFGFKFTDTKIQGFANNAGAPTFVDLITGLTPGEWQEHKYKAVFTAGVKVDFYIDGVLLGTITTTLPSAGGNSHIPCKFSVKSGHDAVSQLYTSGFSFQQDL